MRLADSDKPGAAVPCGSGVPSSMATTVSAFPWLVRLRLTGEATAAAMLG